MPDKGFDLGDYVEVKDRIRVLYEQFGMARIVTSYELTVEPDDKPKVICRALVYRTVDDPHPATGTSWLYLPGTTPYTRGSEVENAETSAVGRAIGMLGILIDKSIASANEIEGKRESPSAVYSSTNPPPPAPAPVRDGLIGKATKGTARTSDYALRQSPDGGFIGFRLEGVGPKAGLLLEAYGPLAEALALNESSVIGQRVQVWGHYTTHKLDKGGSYDAFVINRIATPDLILPAAVTDSEPTDPEIDALPLFQDSAA